MAQKRMKKQSLLTPISTYCFLVWLLGTGANVAAAFVPPMHGLTLRSSIEFFRERGEQQVPSLHRRHRPTLPSELFFYGGAAAPNKNANKVQMAIASNNAFRGKLLILASKLFVSPLKYVDALKKVLQATYWPEVVLITALVQAVPMARWWYWRWYSSRQRNDDKHGDNLDDEKSDENVDAQFQAIFASSKTLKLARAIQQVGLLQATLYTSDVLLVFLKHMGFTFVVQYQAQRVAGAILTSCWAAYNASRLKYYYLYQQQQQRQQQQQLQINTEDSPTFPVHTPESVMPRTLNRLGDIFIYACAFLTIVDLLGIEIGFALKSIFGLGSFGTLALSLASKDLAAEFVGGLMIRTSNFFHEGETVSLQDGTKGTVARIGWLHTYIYKQEDNSIVRVPNSQISHQRISRARRQPSHRGGRGSIF